MPDPARRDRRDELFVRAAFVVATGQAQLQADTALVAPLATLLATVEDVASQLKRLLPEDGEHDERCDRLLAWRDHLSSHLLAARALTEVRAAPDMAARLLERGLADVAAQIAQRRRADAAEELLRDALRSLVLGHNREP
jgi:hypothetical protein